MTSRNCAETPRKSGSRIARAPLAAALLLLMTLIVPASAQQPFTIGTEWVAVAAAIMIVAVALLAIVFMVSRLFGISAWEAWVNEELINVLFSAVIIVLFIAFAGVIESVASGLANDMLSSTQPDGSLKYWTYVGGTGRWGAESKFSTCPSPCQFYLARGFLGAAYEQYGKMVSDNAQSLAGSLDMESAGAGGSITIQPFILKIDISYALPLYSGRAIFNNSLSMVVEELLKLTSALKMQEVALGYAAGLAAAFFIVGILTRMVWFLRKFGGLLVALGIGLYTVLPLVYILGWYTIDRSTATLGENLAFTPASCAGPDESTCTGTSIGELGNIGGVDSNTLGALFTKFDSQNRVAKMGLLDALGRAYLPSIVLPMLAIFVTIGFVRHFSPMVGGDTEIAGLTRII